MSLNKNDNNSSSSDDEIETYVDKTKGTGKMIEQAADGIVDEPAELPLDKLTPEQRLGLLSSLAKSDLTLEDKTELIQKLMPQDFNSKVPADANYMPMARREFLKHRLQQRRQDMEWNRKSKSVKAQLREKIERREEKKQQEAEAKKVEDDDDEPNEDGVENEKKLTKTQKRRLRKKRQVEHKKAEADADEDASVNEEGNSL